MTILGIRFCHVAAPDDAEAIASQLSRAGFAQMDLAVPAPEFPGAVFPASDGNSWFEVWPANSAMPAGTMLQLLVDDADAYAAEARANGLNVAGPTDAHGEHIYLLSLPGGLQMTFQSPPPLAS